MKLSRQIFAVILACLQVFLPFPAYAGTTTASPSGGTTSLPQLEMSASVAEGEVQTIESTEYFTLNQVTLQNGELLQDTRDYQWATDSTGRLCV